eukprot:CAMPEP_0170067492 /NCGR_PEP_ID=MMETSP0019_2-20121128/6818_1 /TAXON_ID=98059 /ORGANISM="Dinobryon sp., Strain UTEXLB2267" /LENGTH=328 /DNA_ID=CAMNT_0010274893 /DNA_START=320 /DNA_END=1306 /DNA_ORIENTATION=-
MLVTNLGGPDETILKLQHADSDYCCHRYVKKGCCPSDPAVFYSRTRMAVSSIVLVRTFLVGLEALLVAVLPPTALLQLLCLLLSLGSAGLVAFAMSSLVNLYERLYEHTRNISGVSKLFLLKFSVTLVVAQGLVQQFLSALGASPLGDAQDTQLAYCWLMLLELAALSSCSWLAFRRPLALPSPAFSGPPLSDTAIIVDRQPEPQGTPTPADQEEVLSPLSLAGFTGSALRLLDLYDHGLTPLHTHAEWDGARSHARSSRTTSRHVSNSSSSSSGSRYYNNMRRSVSSADSSGHERYDISTLRPFSHDSPTSVSVDSNGRIRPLLLMD